MRKATHEQKERAQEKRQKLREIARNISKMSEEDRLALVHDWPTTIDGHKLSLHNACMIAVQSAYSGKPTPTVLGGFRQWQAAGRSVMKGQHGLGIWIPTGVGKKTEADDTETIHEGSELRFVVGTVFDVSQTQESGDGAGFNGQSESEAA